MTEIILNRDEVFRVFGGWRYGQITDEFGHEKWTFPERKS